MELYRLAETCNYGELKDEMVRDRVVVGIRDAALSQQLQIDAKLTLDKAKKKSHCKSGGRATGGAQKSIQRSD